LIVAYLINQYPQPSQTFIRREIAGVESAGATVLRFTVRQWSGKLLDPDDIADQKRTKSILAAGPMEISFAVVRELFTRPNRFLRCIRLMWKFHRASTRGLAAQLMYVAEACVLRQWLYAARVAHLHAHFGTNSTTVASLCHELGGPPYSFTVHGPEEFDQPVGLSLREKVHHAAFAVTISTFGRSQLCRWSEAADWSKIHIVRCGVGPDFLQHQQAERIIESRFVCVARLEPQKGLLVLIEAVALLVREGVKLELTLVGDGSMRAMLETQINKLGLGGVVRMTGWQSGEQIRREMLNSRALVLPSFAEGLPVVLMESLALQLPVIATWVAGIPE
jgi:colanic acid/amylovoran biosynthesis glycosyltransferase